jgi:hypothetical protein
VTAALSRRRYKVVPPDHAGDSSRGVMQAAGEGLPGRDAERFRMGPAVVLGQDIAEAPGPVCDGAVADLAAGDWQLDDGHRERRGGNLLIAFMVPARPE